MTSLLLALVLALSSASFSYQETPGKCGELETPGKCGQVERQVNPGDQDPPGRCGEVETPGSPCTG
jgi:hypothetical protein